MDYGTLELRAVGNDYVNQYGGEIYIEKLLNLSVVFFYSENRFSPISKESIGDVELARLFADINASMADMQVTAEFRNSYMFYTISDDMCCDVTRFFVNKTPRKKMREIVGGDYIFFLLGDWKAYVYPVGAPVSEIKRRFKSAKGLEKMYDCESVSDTAYICIGEEIEIYEV